MSNYKNLELEGFKVVRVKVHNDIRKPMAGFLPDILQIQRHILLFSRYLTLKVFSIGVMIKINYTSALADTNIPDFHQKQ